MKEILAKVFHFFTQIKVRFVCLFKLTFRLESKEDKDVSSDDDDGKELDYDK